MKEKIKEFIYPLDANVPENERLKALNHSGHENMVHQALFYSIDEFAKQVVKDLHNSFSHELFLENQLNLVSDEPSIEEMILSSLRKQGHDVKSLNNPELIYEAFNFIKPSNLLPQYNTKLILIKQYGISESGMEKAYVINPYFFGFKLAFDIYLNSLFCFQYDEDLESGLIAITRDKYGEEFENLYYYVSQIINNASIEGGEKGDKEDETFIAGSMAISGINDRKVFHNFIYNSAMLTASKHSEIFKGPE